MPESFAKSVRRIKDSKWCARTGELELSDRVLNSSLGRLKFTSGRLHCGLDTGCRQTAEFSFEVQSDLAAVKTAVFYEDFIRAISCDDDTGQIDSRHVGFKSVGTYRGTAVGRISDLNSDFAEKV